MKGVTCAGCILMTMALIVCVQGQNITLRGVHYANNSEVLLTDIGEGVSALLCLTSNTQCCKDENNPNGGRLGEWYFPNGSTPRGSGSGNSIYRNRGPSVVQLNRRHNAQSPTGAYRCEIPDASGTNQTIRITLTESSPSTTTPMIPVPRSPTNLTSPSQSPTSITLSWEQPVGDAVDRYNIVYTYQGGCSDYTQPENMATVNDGNAREYTLQNLQEFSDYNISVTAVNELGASAPAMKLIATRTAPISGPPQSVMMSSVTSSSITVQWGRVKCINGNSEITGYTVRYGETGSTTTVMESVSGTSDSDRMFTASGLIPVTNYTFEVAAAGSEGTGPFSTGTTVETLAPEAVLFQVRIVGQLDCGAWIVNNNDQKRDDIAEHIVVGVEELCNCGFSRRNITNDAFQCFSADAVTYRGTLHGSVQASSLQLAGFIEQWTAAEQVIPVQGVFLTVDSSCSVIIESLHKEECGTATTVTGPSDSTTNPSDNMASPSDNMPSPSDNTAAIIAGVVVVICVVAIAIAVTISIPFIVVKSRTKRREGAAELKVISTAPCAAYEPTATQGQEYEVVDRRSEPVYEYIQPAATTPLGGGAEYANIADVK